MSGKSKGSAYERETCGILSKWITKGENDSVLWRSAGSGSRATTRGKKGKTSKGHSGDISSTDPISADLVALLSIEIKRGYSSNTIADLLDKNDNSAKQCYEKWIDQCKESKTNGGTYSWLLIVKRDRRDPICFFPSYFLSALQDVNIHFRDVSTLQLHMPEFKFYRVVGMKLNDFLSKVTPEHITLLRQAWRK